MRWTSFVHMRTVTVRDLRNDFSRLETWLGEGEKIQIEKHGQPIAVLTGLPKAAESEFGSRISRLA
jgi:antitoxin (DNA-binding transcriptional repressor) of toxin-antitoxin stability system